MDFPILKQIQQQSQAQHPMLAVLIDPDKAQDQEALRPLIQHCNQHQVDFIFVGGSTVQKGHTSQTVQFIKENTKIPVLLFPGHSNQICEQADALLFLSLISGRNPEFLIGHHIKAAQTLRKWQMETIPTGYLLIDGGRITSVAAVSQTIPLPADQAELITSTALAGTLLGMKLIYLEAGSGALQAVTEEVISLSKQQLDVPLIVGGGINNAEKAQRAWQAGADIIVMGNSLEQTPDLLPKIIEIRQNFREKTEIQPNIY